MTGQQPSYDDDDREAADDFFHELLRQVVAESYSRSKSDCVARALLCFLVRAANSWRSIRILSKSATNEAEAEGMTIDAATLLRATYDAYFQAEYLVQVPDQSEQRATDYFEFEHVDRYKRMKSVLNHDNWIAKRLKASPKRDAGESNNQVQFDRVKHRFFTKKSSIRNHWHSGNLRDVAKWLEKEDEYDTFLAAFNGCVHTSALASRFGPPISAGQVLSMASIIAAKTLQLNVAHNGINLQPTQKKVLDVLCSPLGDRGI